jgi:hypothetical protein
VPYNATVVESSDLGLWAWSLDPAAAIVSAALATTVQYLAAVYYRPDPATAPLPTRVLLPNGVAGTSTILQAALINMDQVGANAPGTVLATSPATGTAAAAGLNSLPLTYAATAPASLPSGRYWVGIMNTTGTTTTFLASSNPGAGNLGVNVGADAAHTRFGIALSTGAFGVSIAPASIVQTVGAGLCLCAALA